MAPRQAAHTADVNRPEFAGVLWSVGLYSGGVCRLPTDTGIAVAIRSGHKYSFI